MLEARVRYFDIKKCGYYLPRNTTPRFGQLVDTLNKLYSWGRNVGQIVNTKTYEADPDNDLRNTYFYNMHHHEESGDFLLILWNEISNDNGKIYGMMPDASPGSSNMLQTGFEAERAIPGFPSYFWFIPDLNLIAAIKFDHSTQAKNNLETYLNGFLANKSTYKVVNSNNEVIGYSNSNPAIDNFDIISPTFHAVSSKNTELEAELIANVNSITRMIKKETLDYALPDNRSTIERIFSDLLANTPEFEQKRNIVHELQYSPTREELIDIIDSFQNRSHESNLNNIGFIYKGGKKIMLSGINVSMSYRFNVNREENEIINAESLLNTINASREDLLSVIN